MGIRGHDVAGVQGVSDAGLSQMCADVGDFGHVTNCLCPPSRGRSRASSPQLLQTPITRSSMRERRAVHPDCRPAKWCWSWRPFNWLHQYRYAGATRPACWTAFPSHAGRPFRAKLMGSPDPSAPLRFIAACSSDFRPSSTGEGGDRTAHACRRDGTVSNCAPAARGGRRWRIGQRDDDPCQSDSI